MGWNWSNAGAGAAAGTAVLPGVGTAVGGVIGGLSGGGGPAGNGQNGTNDGNEGNFGNWLSNLASGAGFGAPTSGPFAANQYAGANQGALNPAAQQAALESLKTSAGPNLAPAQVGAGGLQSAMNLYAAQANGGGPQLAAQQAMQSGQQAQAQGLGAVAAQRGLSPGQAARLGGQVQNGAVAAAGANAANATLQQQMNAQAGLVNAGAAAGGLGVNMAGVQQANNQFNAGQYDSLVGAMEAQNATLQAQQNQQIATANTAGRQASAQGITSLGSGLMSGGSALLGGAAMSDRRQKTNIEEGDALVEKVLEKIAPYAFDYRNPKMAGAGRGRRLGIMAQDLEKAGPIGKALVINDPDAKRIDTGGALSLALAALANQHKRIAEMEKRAA